MSVAGGPKIVTDGLILYLDAADISSYPRFGNTWYDLSGNEFHAGGHIDGAGIEDSNFPSWSNVVSGSFYFPGTGTYGFKILSDMGSHTEITHETWLYRNGISTSRYLWDARSGGGGWCLTNYLSNNISLTALLTANNPPTYQDNSVWFNRWTQWVTTSDSSGSKLYIDGTQIVGNMISSSDSYDEDLGVDFRIGIRYTSDFGPFNGYISSHKIYNKVLSNSEVFQNYNSLKGRYNL